MFSECLKNIVFNAKTCFTNFTNHLHEKRLISHLASYHALAPRNQTVPFLRLEEAMATPLPSAVENFLNITETLNGATTPESTTDNLKHGCMSYLVAH